MRGGKQRLGHRAWGFRWLLPHHAHSLRFGQKDGSEMSSRTLPAQRQVNGRAGQKTKFLLAAWTSIASFIYWY
jgi:hypothetical protein